MNHLLEVKNLSYAYHTLQGETLVLDRVSFSIEPGEFVAIVGPSGCGKSTLLSLICRLLQPDQGTILLQENKKTGYMLQKDHLLEWRTTHKNIALGPEITHQTADGLPQKIDNMLKKYQLDGFRNAKPNQLSGGMRQRAALIRTLMLEPDLLLLDEPFSALDYQTRLTVSDDIGQIIRQSGKTALLVTHDLSEAISLSDRVIVLTNRPANVRCEIPIFFKLEQDTPLNRRNAPEFKHYFNQIWKELNHDN